MRKKARRPQPPKHPKGKPEEFLSGALTKGVREGVTQSELYHRYEEEGLKGG